MGIDTSPGGLREFVQKSLDGPVMRELDFDVKLTREVRRLTSEYSIRFNPEEIICDDETADAIWQAALELLERVGIYNLDTNRVVMLERKKTEAEAARAPKEFVVGSGKDAVTIRGRSHDSSVPPVIMAVPHRSVNYRMGIVSVFMDILNAYISDAGPLGELARRLRGELDGIPHLAKTPGEMVWGRAMARWQRAIAEALGKPGLWVGSSEEITPAAILACYGEGLLNRFIAQLGVPLMPELKLNWDRLSLAYAAKEMGVRRYCGAQPVLGGIVRSSEEAAIVGVATTLGSMAYAGDQKASGIGVVERQGYGTPRGPMQASSGARRAIERHLGIPIHAFHQTKNFGTSLGLYELAATVLAETGSGWSWAGYSYICGPGPDGEYRVELDHTFVTKICRGAAGLSREKTNELLLKLLPLYEGQEVVDKGKRLFDYYDIKTLTPSRELVALHDRVEDELQRLGVPMASVLTGD